MKASAFSIADRARLWLWLIMYAAGFFVLGYTVGHVSGYEKGRNVRSRFCRKNRRTNHLAALQ